jgi:ATP-binding cassette, subfamily C, bacterial
MIDILKLFFGAERTKPWLVLICLTVASMLEAIGVSTLLPVANKLMSADAADGGFIERATTDVLSFFGMQPTLGNLLILICSVMFLRALILFGAMSYASLTAARVVTNLRRGLIKSVFEARWSYYSDKKGGALAASISSEAQQAGTAYTTAALTTSLCLQLTAYVLVGLLLNWRAAAAGVVAALLLAIGSRQLIFVTRRAGKRLVSRTAGVTEDMMDLLRNIKSLKAMNSYEPLIEQITFRLGRLKKSIIKINLSGYGLNYGTDAAMIAFICLAIYLSNKYAGMTLPQLTLLGLIFFQVVNYAAKLQRNLQHSSGLAASYANIRRLTEEANAVAEQSGGTRNGHLDATISFDRVSFSHEGSDTPVLRDASLNIPVNRITVLTGPSGSGKTTLIDMLTGLYQPLSGSIRVGQDDLSEFNLKSWRKLIGYVAQDLVLFHDTVRANISLGNTSITDADINEALRQANALDFVNALPDGLDTDVGEHGGKLSGGQRQRIALARALVNKPKLLILDEVTSALDPDSEAEIIKNIAGLGRQYTIVCITHRPGWKDIADKLYHVNAGRVTEG